MLDVNSYTLGYNRGKGDVAIESGITCTDDGEGNITITEVSENG